MIGATAALLDAPGRRRLLLCVLTLALASVVEAATLLALRPVLEVLAGGRRPWPAAAGMLAGASVWAGLTATGVAAGRACGYQLSGVLHDSLAAHLLRLPLAWFGPRRVGEVTRLVGSQVMDVMTYPAHLLAPRLRSVVTPLALVGATALLDPVVAVVILPWFPVLALLQRWSARTVAEGDQRLARARAEAADRVLETAELQRVVRSSPDPDHATRLTDAALTEVHRTTRGMVLAVLPALGTATLVVQAQLVTTLLVVLLRHGGPTTPEELARTGTMLVLVVATAAALGSAHELHAAVRMSRAALDRIRAVLGAPVLPEPGHPVAAPLPASGTELELVGVSAGYDPATPVLHDVDLRVPAGTTTALVGSSGSGKTTLLRLAARFLDPGAGRVRLDGVDARDLGSTGVHRRVAMVFQDVELFSGTIADNVLSGRAAPDPDELADVLAASGVDDLVARLPDGLDTVVGESGTGLSGGERQRVSVARALRRRAPLLLLDEAGSGLDAHGHRRLEAALDRLRGRCTVLMVVHRLESARAADQVVVLEAGRVVQRGTHDQLLATEGPYRRLWRSRDDDAPTTTTTTTKEML